MQTTSRLDDLILRALLGGAGLVLFEERGARGLGRRAVEAARLCGREGDVAVLDLSTRHGVGSSRRDAVGIDLAAMAPPAAAAFVADLAVPPGTASAWTWDGVRDVARGYLDLVRGPPITLTDLADLADAPAHEDVGEVRLALARLKLHLHRHARCLDPGSRKGLDPVRAANGGSVLIVQHDPGGRGDLLAAVAGLLARCAGPAAGTLWAVRDPSLDPRPSPCVEALARGGVALRAEPGGWASPIGRGVRGGESAESRLRGMRDARDLTVDTERERGMVAVGMGGDRVLAAVSGPEVLLVVRERDGWVGAATLRRPEPGAVPRYLAHALALAALRGLVETGTDAAGIDVPGAGTWSVAVEGRRGWRERMGRLACASPLVRRFVTGLDLDLREACHDAGRGSDLHGWVNRRGGDPRARRDFVCTWRALSVLAWKPGFAGAVDLGARTVPLVARTLGIDQAKARRLQGRTLIPQAWLDDIEEGVETPFPLGALDVNHMPRLGDREGWASFVRCVEAVDGLRARLTHPDPGILLGLVLRSGRDWRGRAACLPARPDALVDAADMVRALGRHLHAAGAVGDPVAAEGLALRLLARRRDLAGLAELSLGWHADPGTGREPFPLAVPDDAVGWPALFEGEVALPGGHSARALTSLGDLRREGAWGPDAEGHPGLAHCVADHARSCAAGRSHIVSIRGPDGLRSSTAEIVPDRAGVPVMTQQRGRANADPPPGARRAAEALMRRLRGRTLRRDHLPPTVPEGDLETRHAAWSPYLPGRLSGCTLAQFLERLARDGMRGVRPDHAHGAFGGAEATA